MCYQSNIDQFATVKYKSSVIEDLFLEYRLLKSKHSQRMESIYSIYVSATQNDVIEYKLAFDVCRNITRGIEIFNLISRNSVTPCTLFDVLEDLL